MKKLSFFLTLSLINGMLVAQSFSGSTNFWNTISVDNPAMSALSNRIEANLNVNKLNSLDYYKGGLIYNQQVQKLKGAVGINSSSFYSRFYFTNRTMATYNYQWRIRPNHTLSFGAGIGLAYNHFDENFFIGSNSRSYGSGALGVAYYTNKFTAGVAYNVVGFEAIDLNSSFNLFAAYRQAIGENFSLSPKLMYTYDQNKFQTLNVALVGEFKQQFILGIGTQNETNPYMLIGYRLKNGLSFTYTFVSSRSKLNNAAFVAQHELNIRFTLPQIDR